MTTMLLVEPRARRAQGVPRTWVRHDGMGGEPTLDTLVSGAWEGLAAHAVASCPVCAGPLRPRYGAGAAPVAGRCDGCGTTLD